MTDPRKPKRHQLDVRPLLARGEEPLGVIVALVGSMQAADELLVVSPFLPSPLIERLRADGFEARPERGSDGCWSTLFRRNVNP
jgi:uncharacterized protein (DUF2249 family)